MSAFARLLHPPLVSRRAYSSFFSSKSGGGGRYFNSAKPPKAIVSGSGGSAAKSSPNSKADSKVDSSSDNAQAAADGSGPTGSGSSQIIKATDPAQSSSPTTGSPPSSSSSTGTDTAGAASARSPGPQYHLHRQHPVITAKDFKLHQFFSLHRPLLLLAHPSAILESPPPTAAAFEQPQPYAGPSVLDEAVESMDADADAARQLTRSLTMSHAGATVAWEATLRRLGIDVDKDAERVGLRQQWDREWQEVLLDSVKRKRRKKMKKHK